MSNMWVMGSTQQCLMVDFRSGKPHAVCAMNAYYYIICYDAWRHIDGIYACMPAKGQPHYICSARKFVSSPECINDDRDHK